MNPISTIRNFYRKQLMALLTGFLLFVVSSTTTAQLGVYSFTGAGGCPSANTAVNSQPANAVFSSYSSVNTSCQNNGNVYDTKQWNQSTTIDLSQYNQFTVTPNYGFNLTLTDITLTQLVDDLPNSGSTEWHLRSSLDGYAADITTGTATLGSQTPTITLPAASFTNIGAVTFRFYITNVKGNGTVWSNDEVTITGTVNASPADPANPTSNSPQCVAPGVTMNFTGSAPVGETWYWQTSATGTSTANSASSYTVTTAGTYYVRSQDNTTLVWSSGAGSVTVAITPAVGTPAFTLGANSTRCQGAGTVTYTATATNNTGITYSIDGTTAAFPGNSINPATGEVTYDAAWSGTSTITASAAGCNGPSTATHTVTTNITVGTPVFTIGATSTRCQGAGSVTYPATASNSTGITYSLDATTDAFPGNSINTTTGTVTYAAGWSGTSTITANAAGCNGPATATHTVTITPTVGTPVFALGATSTRCQAAGTVSYTATATNNAGITYSLDGTTAAFPGNSIDAATGDVTYDAAWAGTSVITVTATGCGGPRTATHTVTISTTVGTPVFTLGATSTRCQGAGSVTYTANAAGSSSRVYSIDGTTAGFPGNTFNSSTGAVTYAAGWSGTTVISVYANGCNGPSATVTHTVTITPTVGTPVFTSGSTSTRCQGAGSVLYDATASNTTGITYTLSSGGSIVAATGQVTWNAGFSGTATITASAAGCNGPRTATHTVTVTPTVGTPVFVLGATSTRCQGAGTVTYTATASNSTGITYSLDATTVAFPGNSIDNSTGEVTYAAGWSGSSIITATAAGCNGPRTATHTVTNISTIGVPVFTLGATSTRCQGAGNVAYTATSAGATGITYSLDATSLGAGNSINAANGTVTYVAGWSGTSTITATATGCNGPTTAMHTVTITPTVGTPVFVLGATSIRCQGADVVNYAATATNSTGITYSLDALSLLFGNTINAATGDVTYVAGWSFATTITASAAGCNGPRTASHVVDITPTVGNINFTLGSTSNRCIGAGVVTYTATSSNNTGITYELDATSLAAGNSINTATGAVTYIAGWLGSSTITATSTGCNGPKTGSHVATTNDLVTSPVFTLGATSVRCQGAATVTYAATATNTTGISYTLDATTDAFPGNSINTGTGAVTYAAGWTGTSIITASAAGCGGPLSATHTVTITPTVGTPVFTLGSTSTRCQAAGTVTYNATSANNTGLTFSLDATSITGGNSIDGATGALTYAAGWSGTSVITATATGCNGPRTATHTVTTNATVGTPVFTLGATSTRCQGSGTVSYTATASSSTSRTYALDATTDAFPGNSINTSTGAVTYAAGWSGTSEITVTANGCSGPTTAIHTVTITPTVSTPVFTLGATSTRCQGAGVVNYGATASNTTGITYSLNGAATGAGNSINSTTGDVTFVAGWTGSTTITASAAGCNGPRTATHTVTITPTVGNPSFVSGATSTRCQGSNTVTYTATATNAVLSYALDAASLAGGVTINAATGAVAYAGTWNGTSVITVTATGCNGPKTASHTVTIIPTVSAPVFALGATSTRCQAGGLVSYAATAANSTNITYSLDAASASAGNSINSTNGTVAFTAAWSGTSIITANAAGCNGPVSRTHTVTITPTVGTPAFTGGATSVRCQGAVTVTYTANATNTTGITYSLDGSSVSGGNSINAATGEVTYAATWSGTTTITASAAGCNGPRTAIHTVTITATVGTPVFAMGAQSTRTQASGTVTYTATATQNTGISYALDAASLAGGNTINTATGAVTWTSGWNGTSMITASATGCNGPSVGSHIVTINPAIVQAPLYLSTGQTLDRVDPVATNITTTLQTGDLSSAATTNVTFTQVPALCANLVIKAQTISVLTYVSITSGIMPANPNITAQIRYGSTNIITLTNPIYNSATQMLTWSAVLGADVTVPSGQAIALQVTTAQAGVVFKIQYHSVTKPSRISLFPVSTFIDITSFSVYNAPYPGGSIRVSGNPGTTMYVRSVVTTPFGYTDITKFTVDFNPPGTTVNAICVDSTACTRTYEYPWTIPAGFGNIAIMGTAYEGFENIIKNSEVVNFSTCLVCAPVALADSATGAGGAPITADVLLNDYDPNNNIKRSTLAVFVQPNNGTGYVSNNRIVYLPNGTYAGKDTLTYQICDSTGLCATAQVFFTVNPLLIDPCSEATKSHVYYMPFSENDARIALDSSSSVALVSNNIRTIISIKIAYPGMTIVWDEWEDGYEANALNPTQPTTKVWGDGNPYNGIAPGYSTDIIPAGGSIVMDNTIPTNPRVQANIFYDGRDKITSSGQITLTQVCGEPSIIGLQCMKTNVSPTIDYGTSFTIPVGQNYNSRDFRYTSLFIRASENNTFVEIDKDNNGSLETTDTLSEGEVLLVNGGVLSGAAITASHPIGVELHFGGNDSYSSRDIPIYPATWYSNIYYSPVPTTGSATAVKDTAAILLYNSLSRPLSINWSSGVPSSGTLNIPAKSVVRMALPLSATAAYKFVNPTGESFTAIEIMDSYTPGGGGNIGQDYDWSFNLIAENRLTDFATIAWAPGSTDGSRNDNPVWVTPTANTTVYVKYDGNVSGTTGLLSPCGLRYDVAYVLNALNHRRILDPNDNDQSGIAIFTCNGAKLAAVYGEDPSTATAANPSWDVGSTIQPFCKQKLIFANDDYARTMVNQPVTIPVLLNDFGFLAVVDPTTVTNTALLQPRNGSVTINANGTIIYTPNPGYVGKDTFEYNVCSTPTPIVCDVATVYVDIAVCPAPYNQNVIAGMAFLDQNEDGINNDGGIGFAGAKVYLYVDGNCNTVVDANELKDSVIVDATGTYQFVTYPEKFVADDFDGTGGTNTCAGGNDGNGAWIGNWSDIGDPSPGFCNNSQTAANTDVEIRMDNAFGYALRLKDANRSATRTVNLSGASYAFLTFSYRRKSASLTAGKNVIVQASSNGTAFATIFTIAGDGTTDANYVTIHNQDITQYASATTYLRFLTNASVADADTVYIDNVKIQFIRYPQCYITRLAPASVPAFHHTTTILQHNFTATSAQTCLAPYDFGIAKNKIVVSGNMFNDANGLTDGIVNGTGLGVVTGMTVYAYLVDASGKVAYRTTLLAGGAFSFPSVDIQTNFTLRLSTTSLNIGDSAPPDAALPTGWLPTGDCYGINNNAGVGNSAVSPSVGIAVNTGTVNITGLNFGIERLPDSDDKNQNYLKNTPGLQYAVPGLTGSDPEDGLLGTGKTYMITSVPDNAVLFYNGALVGVNTVFTSFNPALLLIDPSDTAHISTFTYASMDAAGLYDPSPATVVITWNQTLPVKLISFSGRLNGSRVDLNWVTANELNTKQFEVERSADGQNFSKIATVDARGNSSTPTSYDLVDPAPLQGVNYYRLKMVDIDGKFEYSQIVIIRIENSVQLITKVAPNPFTGKIDVYLTLTHNTPVDFRFIDINGRMVFSKSVKGLKGFNWFTINDLDKLPSAPYMLHIKTDDAVMVQKLIKQ